MSRSTLILGTRGSKLAVHQSQWVQARLQELAPGLTISLQRIQTSGDKILDVPLAKIGGKGLFVKEIEDALLSKEIDLAVHSMKDVPTALPEGLDILCVPPREDPRDALITRDGCRLDQLKPGARIGTSSLRRQAQLLHYRPDFTIEMLRGNLDTRLRKLREGQFDAIVLAAAGLRRLAWDAEITEYLPVHLSLPAIAQGALGIEARSDDTFVRELLSRFEHRPTRITVTAERALLHRLEGGCQVPIAAHAELDGDRLTVDGLVASVDGRRVIRHQIQGPASEAQALGTKLAERLLADGGDVILKEIYGQA
ncbi:MAG: hydroxymethylbilane synthase [Nitrospira sp.]|jgi:hydroxymethylbilane synthase|uniref:hydroxymethylbilane synthase n=1 Tax=Nitrospira sp. ND1 TaxID=1658518 RepID=UPI0009BC219D|nr:hydroxymethylbilane synthase [Nitrospira sp. ND1]MBK7420796.1 hydroxymethylbilane synthase [Nitrospira sp.]MBK7487952.1 hydroxymethylbilane synthase [Nitrospira sp.]MBK9996373.1 hydroxymethylbilane synthase [Nitrospira sp.]MBP6206451.1 hydroxymethylbilane synthase [Nitrospira sp.]MBP7361597.1 hydroxymethylbilane synthase [Nitrospira sp.]